MTDELATFVDRYTMRHQRTYPHPIERVWEAVTTAEHLDAWMLPVCQVEARLGGSWSFTFADPDGVAMEGVIVEFDPPRVVADPPDDATAEINLKMSADDAHRFWQGKLNMTVALAKKQVQVAGPMAKMMKLLPALRPAFPRYVEFLQANGHADKVL